MTFVPCFDEGKGLSLPSSSCERSGQSGTTSARRSGTFGQLSAAAGARVVDWLRRRYPSRTAVNVAADTGLSAETVDKWINRASAPSIGAFLALVSAYGPELLSAAYDRPPEWIDEAARAADAERTRAQIAALTERLTRLEVRP